MTTAVLPASPAPSSNDAIDQALVGLRPAAARWATLPVTEKIKLFRRLREGIVAVAGRWSAAGAQAKGLTGTPLAGEEALSGPWALLYALDHYLTTLGQIDKTGAPQIEPSRIQRRSDGQVVASVFPGDAVDALLLGGIRAEVWMEPGVTPEQLPQTMGVWYRNPAPEPRVALVLGAGNISSIPPLDVLYKMIAEGAVCVLKMNPVNDYLGPIFEEAFAALVDAGYLRFVYGGREAGEYLCAHPSVDEIHITGSDKTHDAIVFGDGPEGAARKARNEPFLRKPITSELGNVSPTIVVPGPWTQADYEFQAEHIATQKLHNGGFNCISSQVLILPADWDGTPRLLAALRSAFERAIDRPAYYPGAAQRCARLAEGHDDAQRFGRDGDGFTARTLVHADARGGDVALDIEAFSSLLAVVTLPGDTEAYLRDAVNFANDRLWGTLGGNLIVHPATVKQHAAALDRAIAAMRFGCVGVNAWTGVGFLLCQTTWGAFPGHTIDDVRSGIGVVHNTYLFSRAQKSVVYAPFAPFPRSIFGYGATMLPKPPWFVLNKNAARIGDALVAYQSRKSIFDFLRVVVLAMTA